MIKQEKQCAKCKAQGYKVEATGLFVGKFYNFTSESAMPYRGYLCDMHADEAESGKFVKQRAG
jgi:hypothetical protein